MKTILKIWGGVMMLFISTLALAQNTDEQRMERDIEVAENVLSTLLRQQFDKQKMFFPLEVKAYYQPGYGVTFRLPADFTTPIIFSFNNHNEDMLLNMPPPEVLSYSYKISGDSGEYNDGDIEVHGDIDIVEDIDMDERHARDISRTERTKAMALREKSMEMEEKSRMIEDKSRKQEDKSRKFEDKSRKMQVKHKGGKREDLDSLQDVYNIKMIAAAKSFLTDYGDLISQLAPEEKIIITNQGEQPRMWIGKLMNAPGRTHLSVEVLKADLNLYKQGKLNRNQLDAKIKVVNTQAVEDVAPDLELLSSIFDRLYQPDLARTYFTEGHIYYERLKDYGVVYYMQVYSSNQLDYMSFSMPTLGLDDIDLETRNKKVKELYPAFEKELKENILEYGRTIKSLQDNEVLVFNVHLTKCKDCGIPATLELSVKSAVLKEYGSGKLTKDNAMSKLSVKKGAEQ